VKGSNSVYIARKAPKANFKTPTPYLTTQVMVMVLG